MTFRSTVLSCALLLTACDVPAATVPADGGPPTTSETPTAHAYRLDIPISGELRTTGGEVSLLRLPNEGALAQETLVVEAGTEVLSVMVTNTESIAVTQRSDDVARSVDVAQPGCGTPSYSTGVVLHVPDDFATIQAAIDAASPGDTVAVGPGVFTEFLSMRPGVRLRGSGAGQTVLDAKGQPRNLIDLTGAPGVVISGFTFRGVPRADLGCTHPEDPFVCSGNWYAAAIYGDGHWVVEPYLGTATPEVDWTVDAPACSGAVALITHNVFENNFVAVMPYFHTRLIVANNIFRDNAFAFAANHLQDRGAVLHNVFWNNQQIAVGVSAGWVDVLDNVIGASSTGYSQEYVQQGRVACNVFWQNVQDIAPDYSGGPLRITLGTEGNLVTDPLFVDVASGDFHLGPGSPAIDFGCSVDGAPDPDRTPADIGAYGGPLGDW